MEDRFISSQEQTLGRLDDIETQGECLTTWELHFVDQLLRLDRNFTLPEHKKVFEIYERRVSE